jgi:hypothetical protein
MLFILGKIIASFAIAYGDFKERKILLLALITLFILNLIESFLLLGVYDLLIITGINLLVVSIIFSTTYFYLKKIKKVKNPAKSHLGIGDWLFFLAITPLFLPEVFIYVFLFMNVIALIYGISATLIAKKQYQIPYAGISAITLVLISIMQYFSPFEILTLT